MTTTIEESIELVVPARTAYDQWTQFETFPSFVDGVESVEQLDARRLRCKARIAGKALEFEAEICEQIPDKRIAWKSTSGLQHSGVVTFHRLDDHRSKVMLQYDVEPSGILESLADHLGVTRRWTRQALASFRSFLEKRGEATGAWRGAIPCADDAEPSGEPATGLAAQECVPCRGGVPPLKGPELAALHRQLRGWELVNDHHLAKDYAFPDFASALAFVDRVGAMAEEQGHHPDVQLSWGRVRLEVYTHKIDGLTESDFVFAARADRLLGPQDSSREGA
jgi:pterin-4a-carbinolamine dehydratase